MYIEKDHCFYVYYSLNGDQHKIQKVEVLK